MAYMKKKLPGARLKVSPEGGIYQSVGACCPSCAVGGRCATGQAGEALTTLLVPVGLVMGAIWLLPRMLGAKK